jgi:hypothetical protein
MFNAGEFNVITAGYYQCGSGMRRGPGRRLGGSQCSHRGVGNCGHRHGAAALGVIKFTAFDAAAFEFDNLDAAWLQPR